MAIIQNTGRATNDLSFARILYENKISSADTDDASAVLIPNTWERYTSASGTVTEDFFFASASKINAIGVAAHNLSSAGASIQFDLSTTNPYASSAFDVAVTPTTNAPLLFLFDDVDDILSMRMTISGGSNREVGVVYAGEAMIMQRALYGGHSPINLSSITDYRNAISSTGNFLGRKVRRKGQQSSFSWNNLTEDWYRETFQPFVTSAKTKPFFIKWRPDYQSDEVAFGYTTGDISPSNQGGSTTRMLSVNMNMRAHDE